MTTLIRRLQRVVLVSIAGAVLTAPALRDPPVERVRLADGRALAFRCSGHGSPTALLEAGWAGSSMAWSKVQRLVAPIARVCSYDRAGLGDSDPGPLPRDGAAIARDLDEALQAAHIAGPFVVVGHSAGGLYVRLFADRRPGDVVGMVLVDPSVAHQDARLAAVLGPGAGSVTGLRDRAAACAGAAARHALPSADTKLAKCDAAISAATYATQAAELDSLWSATSDEVDAGRASYGSLPLIVLTAADTNAAAPPAARAVMDRVWAGLHDEIAERSSRGVRRTVEQSGHLIPRDRPDAVAAAIADVISASRSRTVAPAR